MMQLRWNALTLFLLVVLIGCNVNRTNNTLPAGKYMMQNSEIDDWAWVLLEDDNTFVFNRANNTSYWPAGTYDIKDNELILRVSEKEQYVFVIDETTLVFKQGEYAKSIIEPGTIFKRRQP